MSIYVIGFLGTNRIKTAIEISKKKCMTFFNLDEEIVKRDGRSLKRICMMMGEHEYRNKEYEILKELSSRDNVVVACGDGVILDDMCTTLLKKNQVIVADASLTVESLWENAKNDFSIPYAFMCDSNLERKKSKFYKLYKQRKVLYDQFRR